MIRIEVRSVTPGWHYSVHFAEGEEVADRIVGGWAPTEARARSKAQEVAQR